MSPCPEIMVCMGTPESTTLATMLVDQRASSSRGRPWESRALRTEGFPPDC